MSTQRFLPDNTTARWFIYVWCVVIAGLAILTAVVYVGAKPLADAKTRARSEEMMYRPEVQQSIRQALQQGMKREQIEQQLQMYAQQEATLMVYNMQRSARRALVIAVIVGAALYWLLARRTDSGQRRLLLGIVVAVLVFDLVHVAWKYILVEDTRQTLGSPEVLRKLQAAPQPFRVALLTKHHPMYNRWVSALLGKHEIECIDVPADSRPTPDVQLFFYSDALSPLRRWQYCNVKYVIGPRMLMEQALRQLGARGLFVPWHIWRENDGEHAVYALTSTLERVYAVGSWIVETNAQAAVAFMNAETNEPWRTAVVHEVSVTPRETAGFTNNVRITGYKPERIEAEVTLSGTGLVVMATAPDAGWRATIDGQPARIVRCNLLHQGIEVPAGEHRIVFTFDTGHWSHTVNDWAYRLLPVLLVGTLGWLGWATWRSQKAESRGQK